MQKNNVLELEEDLREKIPPALAKIYNLPEMKTYAEKISNRLKTITSEYEGNHGQS